MKLYHRLNDSQTSMTLPQVLGLAPAKPEDVLDQFKWHYESLIGSPTRNYTPFVWPYRALGPHLLIGYLLLPPTLSRFVHWARYPVFATIVYWSVSAIQECRSSSVTVAYGIGLLNAWTILWSACFLIFNDARKDFKRIERRSQVKMEEKNTPADEEGSFTSSREASVPARLKIRYLNGSPPKGTANEAIEHGQRGNDIYIWQKLPHSFFHRLDWVTDLVTNFRGLGWAHQISGTLPPPSHIQASLHYPGPPPEKSYIYPTRGSLLRSNLPAFVLCCISLDVLKALMSQDPYFWSLPSSTPSPFPHPRLSRLLLSVICTYTALLSIFLLDPLGFACLLGPHILGDYASPWLYPRFFGSPVRIWKKGIAGLWGEWWHQLFRYAFEATGEFLCGTLLGLKQKSTLGSLVRVLTAFICSGALHACASYTTLGNTRPMEGAFAFFALQPIGIIAQRAFTGWIRKQGLREKMPTSIRGVGNVLVVLVWCWVTGPLVADDFAAGGIWLFEPLPISPIRGMMGQGWLRWDGSWVRWHTGDKWWQSGLAF